MSKRFAVVNPKGSEIEIDMGAQELYLNGVKQEYTGKWNEQIRWLHEQGFELKLGSDEEARDE